MSDQNSKDKTSEDEHAPVMVDDIYLRGHSADLYTEHQAQHMEEATIEALLRERQRDQEQIRFLRAQLDEAARAQAQLRAALTEAIKAIPKP